MLAMLQTLAKNLSNGRLLLPEDAFNYLYWGSIPCLQKFWKSLDYCFLGLLRVKRAVTILSITLLLKRTFIVTYPSISIIHLGFWKTVLVYLREILKVSQIFSHKRIGRSRAVLEQSVSSRAYINKYSKCFHLLGNKYFQNVVLFKNLDRIKCFRSCILYIRKQQQQQYCCLAQERT